MGRSVDPRGKISSKNFKKKTFSLKSELLKKIFLKIPDLGMVNKVLAKKKIKGMLMSWIPHPFFPVRIQDPGHC